MSTPRPLSLAQVGSWMLVLLTGSACVDVDDLVFDLDQGGSGGGGTGTGTGASTEVGGSGGAGGSDYGYREVVLDDEPALYYRLNEPGNSVFVADSSGNDRDAVVQLGAGSLDFGEQGALFGDSDTALRLSNGVVIELEQNAIGLDGLESYSVEAWLQVHYDDLPMNILVVRNGSGADVTTFFAGSSFTHKRHDGLDGFEEISHPLYLRDDLHHVVFTFDGVEGKIYYNGAFSTAMVLDLPLPPLTGSVTVAATSDTSSFTADELAFYTTALPEERIEAHYDCGSRGLCVAR